jgi:transposase
LARSLEGQWEQEQLFLLGQARLTYAHYQEQRLPCQGRIEEQRRALESRKPQAEEPAAPARSAAAQKKAKGFDLSAELQRIAGVDLTAIDGVGPVTAQGVLSEIGTEMNRWLTDKHFSSWLGLCPDHRISGGKILGRPTRPVVSRARNALPLAAYSLEHSHSWLGAKDRRLKRKLARRASDQPRSSTS